MATTKVWLTIKPIWSNHRTGPDGSTPGVDGMRVSSVLKTRPKSIDGVAVTLTLNIPDEAFYPLRPEVTIDVPEAALHYEPQVTVEFPDAEQERHAKCLAQADNPKDPICIGCAKRPDELSCYEGCPDEGETAAHYVIHNEGTYNWHNGHFLCDGCYIKNGSPSGNPRWICP